MTTTTLQPVRVFRICSFRLHRNYKTGRMTPRKIKTWKYLSERTFKQGWKHHQEFHVFLANAAYEHSSAGYITLVAEEAVNGEWIEINRWTNP